MASASDPGSVVIVYNESMLLVKGEPQDLLAERGVIACAQTIAKALASSYRVDRVPMHSDIELALAPYPPTEWVVFNLGEGLDGRLFEEARIVWALEAMGYRFTGSGGDAMARSINKALAKERLTRAGIPTPPWRLLRDPAETVGDLSFPAIVKPVAEDGSLGIGPEAVVHDLAGLRARVAHILTSYRQAALVEQFIIGRELNVSVWGNPPEVLPLAEIDFSAFPTPYERIVSFAAKWDTESFAYTHTPVICPAPIDGRLGNHIRELALAVWETFGCRGYARVDMRVDEQDIPFVIEVNCNPDLSPDAGFYRAARAAGYGYVAMVRKILDLAC
jgi:D-alanine-D-alanine ligase